MPIDISEKGLETLIYQTLTGSNCLTLPGQARDLQAPYGGNGWLPGYAMDYDRDYCVDLNQLRQFLKSTQPKIAEELGLDDEGPTRRSFLARLQGEISKHGVIHILRHGLKHNQYHLDLFYGTPSEGNPAAAELFKQNRFTVTRQLRYSRDETKLSLDLCLFINGLPVITFELKNNLTKQSVADAENQYKTDRDPRERLFEFGRCMVHMAVDENEVRMCTHLKGKRSWFLPLNKGWDDGAGNPPNPDGLKTDYLWKELLTPKSLTDIIENYAQIVEEKDSRSERKEAKQIFPRYHQLDVVRKLLADVKRNGVGRRYLIQHSAGSGKSNSIAWLAHQLIPLNQGKKPIFDSIIVVTDRRILDKQIRDTIKQYAQVSATIGAVTEGSGQLRKFIEEGKKIIITTIQKFPFILDEIGDAQRSRNFAIIIDEAHSSQGGKTSAALSSALSPEGEEGEEETYEDIVNRIMESRRLLTNASYFAFTATPKNKTLELFGEPYVEGVEVFHRPFHSYSMKQAIQEGFILDVLANYTPINSYYKLIKKIEGDPEFDSKKAKKKLRKYVEGHKFAINEKAEIMVEHFHDAVLSVNKIGGKARAMVVTNGVDRAIQYFFAFNKILRERKSPWKAIVAFSGEREFDGKKVTEATLNGFPSNQIVEKIEEDPYRFLICADKFQTGYDQPLLHTMYVDKILDGIKAVQTLSRLNRAHPEKHDVFVLDFMNDADTILEAFSVYYRTTILAGETDPNRLNDLKAELDKKQVYTEAQVESLVAMYLQGADRRQLDPILDACSAVYNKELNTDEQMEFKGDGKAFSRTYNFLSLILPYTNDEWEKLSIFLNFLLPKLPKIPEEDLAKGILETIDMDSYRVEKQKTIQLKLEDDDGVVVPPSTLGGSLQPEPEMDHLSNIINAFNDQFGNIDWADIDRVQDLITQEIPARVAADSAYQNAIKNSDRQNARIEHDQALIRVMTNVMKDDTELFKQFFDNESFKNWLSDRVFSLTYDQTMPRGA